jgi:hypothetical protein
MIPTAELALDLAEQLVFLDMARNLCRTWRCTNVPRISFRNARGISHVDELDT